MRFLPTSLATSFAASSTPLADLRLVIVGAGSAGTGIAGLGGMRECEPLGSGTLWRPLLAVPRGDLRAYAEADGCRRQFLLGYFGEMSTACGNCDNCLSPPQTFDATEASRQLMSAVYRTGQRFGAGGCESSVESPRKIRGTRRRIRASA